MNNYEILQHGRQYKESNVSFTQNDTVVLKCNNCGAVVRTTDYGTSTQYNEVYYHFTCPECNCVSDAERIYGV